MGGQGEGEDYGVGLLILKTFVKINMENKYSSFLKYSHMHNKNEV